MQIAKIFQRNSHLTGLVELHPPQNSCREFLFFISKLWMQFTYSLTSKFSHYEVRVSTGFTQVSCTEQGG